MNWILTNYVSILEAIGLVIAGASIITGLTPSPKDDQFLKKIINIFSVVTHKDQPGTFKFPLK